MKVREHSPKLSWDRESFFLSLMYLSLTEEEDGVHGRCSYMFVEQMDDLLAMTQLKHHADQSLRWCRQQGVRLEFRHGAGFQFACLVLLIKIQEVKPVGLWFVHTPSWVTLWGQEKKAGDPMHSPVKENWEHGKSSVPQGELAAQCSQAPLGLL